MKLASLNLVVNIMKYLIFIVLILSFRKTVTAQWTSGSGTTHTTDNIGIGTSSPVKKLDVYGGVKIQDNGTVQTGVNIYSEWPNTYPSSVLNFWAYYNTNHPQASIEAGQSTLATNDGAIAFKTMYQGAAPTERMRITSSGNIGIGTASPAQRLDVQGSVKIQDGGTVQTGVNIYSAWPNTHHASALNFWSYYNTNDPQAIIEAGQSSLATNDGTIVFKTMYQGSAPGERLRITGLGNVGIGTTDPQGYKLAVNGNIRAKEIKVETGWSDFVFEPDYKLLSLRETEDFIKKNKHLPEIPSANEVDANGINLGEMNSKLLQKIEELTLHLISQNKTQQALINDVIQLKSEIKQLKAKPRLYETPPTLIHELLN